MYNNILFDLDGTLTDPMMGITNAVMYSLKKFGIEESDRTKLYKFIGPPLSDSYSEYYGFAQETIPDVIKAYREYYSVTGLLENQVYDGTEKLLIDLKAAGKKLYVATSKPDVFSVKILEHFGLAKYFDGIAGATMNETRTTKVEVIRYAFDAFGIHDFTETIMVGDRKHDVLGAKEAGIDCIGVLFGYGDRCELETAGAAYIAKNHHEIGKIIGIYQ